MIIERKPKSALVEEVMNFKKEDKQEVVEEVKAEEENKTLQESNIKPSEEILKVEVKEDECENCIECADRKAVAEQVTKLKEEHIKHKVTKKGDKFIIECFGKVEKKQPVKESWEGEAVIDDLIDRANTLIKEGHDSSDAVSEAIDEGLIYTQDIFDLAEHYGSIEDSDLIESFYDDLYNDIMNGLDIDESLKHVKEAVDDKNATDTEVDTVVDKARAYWANEVKFQLENLEDLSKDERILKASEEQIEDMANRIADKIINDDNIWDTVNTAIKEYILKDEYMAGAEMKNVAKEVKTSNSDANKEEKEEKKESLDIKKEEESNKEETIIEKVENSIVSKIKSKILHYLKKIGYDEKDFNDYFVIQEKEFINDEGDKATHIQIRNDLVDFYEAEESNLISELDEIVNPGYFEPYDAYVWDAYIWDFEKESMKDKLAKAIYDRDINEDLEDELEVSVEEPVVDNVDDDVSNIDFSVEEVKEVAEEVAEKMIDNIETKGLNIDTEEWKEDATDIVDEKVDEKKEEEAKSEEGVVVPEVSAEGEVIEVTDDEDISEEDAQFLENLNISNNYKNDVKEEVTENTSVDNTLNEQVVIKDDLGIAEDLDSDDALDDLVDLIK